MARAPAVAWKLSCNTTAPALKRSPPMPDNSSSDPTKDIFGFSKEAPVEDPDEDPENDVAVEIDTIIPIEPGYRAAMDDGNNGYRLIGVVCLAMMRVEDAEGEVQYVAPMGMEADGHIADVNHFDGFICVIPPGVDVKIAVAVAKKKAAEAAAQVATTDD
jgi:hypothetical protein